MERHSGLMLIWSVDEVTVEVLVTQVQRGFSVVDNITVSVIGHNGDNQATRSEYGSTAYALCHIDFYLKLVKKRCRYSGSETPRQ